MTGPEHGRVTVPDRGRFERVLRAVREVLTIVALLLAVYLMIAFAFALSDLSDRLGDLGQSGG